jgi:phage baseplate assembly protein gpV
MTSAKAWREHLRNRMSSREGMIARNRSQELGDAIVRELAAASTGSASRAARSAVRAGLDELGLSPETLQRLGLAPSGSALAAGSGANIGGGVAPSRSAAAPVASNNPPKPVNAPSSTLPTVPVETALQEWLKAWSDRRADDYLNFYDARYAPLGGVDRAVWAKQRRNAIRHPDWIKVKAEQVSATEMSPEEAVVGFTQVYSASNGHRETTRKSMIWRWSDGHWRIVSEQATKMAVTAKAATAGLYESAQAVEAKVAERKVPESKTANRVQREADAAQSKAQRELEAVEAALAKLQREAEAAKVKVQREAEAAQLKAQREGEVAQLKAQREADAARLKARRDEELAAARAKREAELASVRAESESKQAAAKAAREVQSNAEKAAREAEFAANQAKREAEAAAAIARKEEKRFSRELLSVPASPSSVTPNATTLISSNAASFESAVRDWVKAWGDRQVDAYLAFYAPGFELPGGQDRAAWAAERRDTMTKPAWLKVRADHLKTSVNGESAEARFFQVYVAAPGTVELSNKTMRWVRADGRWQIVQEHSEPHQPRKRAGK